MTVASKITLQLYLSLSTLYHVLMIDSSTLPSTYSQHSASVGSVWAESSEPGSKAFRRKRAPVPNVQTCPLSFSKRDSIHTVLGIVNRDDVSTQENVCRCYANSTAFYIRDLNTSRFWNWGWSWNELPTNTGV